MNDKRPVESGMEPPARTLRCPVCKSDRFEAFNGRDNARCSGCKSMERSRLLWMVLERFGLFRPGLRVLHLAPEMALARRFSELCGERYHACDIDPKRYASRFTTVRPLDLCHDLVKLPGRSFDLILHNHVLEHVRCEVEPVLEEFERVLAPGGHHFFSTPISGELTREDLSDNLTPQHRLLLFGQEDHYRVFGERSIGEMLRRVWKKDEALVVEPLEFFSEEQLAEAGIPETAWRGVSSHSIFHHVRPVHNAFFVRDLSPGQAVARESDDSPARSEDRAAGDPDGKPRLLLHIGMPKTGTSSLQRWLSTNRESNLAAGADYWREAENHSEVLFMGFASDERIARGRMWFQRQERDEPVPPRAACRSALDRFLSGLDGRLGIVSGEAMWTFSRPEVEGLARYLADRSARASVLCWVRKPVEYFVSATQQRCRSDLAAADIAAGVERQVVLNFARLDHWLDAFGRENVLVRPHKDDTVGDFRAVAGAMGVALTAPAGAPLALNPSISLTAAKALLALNDWRRAAADGGRGEARSMLLSEILRAVRGDPFMLPEATLRRMRARFGREMDYLAERFSMDLESLAEPVASLDDPLFFGWSDAEVETLLGAINQAMLEIEALLSPDAPRGAGPRLRQASAAARAASSAARSSPRNRAPRRKP